MKRIGIFSIFLLFLFIIIPNTYAAVTQEECNAGVSPETCPAGCEYVPEMDGCTPCMPGYYKSEIGAQECTRCTIKPSNANFTSDDANRGMTEDMCPWEIICNAGQYFDGSQCLDCGNHYLTDNYACPILGTGATITAEDYANCTLAARCDGKVYKLKLHSNGAPQTPDTQPLDKEGYFKYDGYAEGLAGFATSSNATVWYDYLPSDLLYKDGPVRSFLGFFDKRPGTNDNATRYFSSNGSFDKTQSELVGLLDKDEIKLYAGWQRDPYFITYVYGNGTTSMETCGEDNKECTTTTANSVANAPDGQTFTGVYKCYINYEDEENRQPCQTPEYKVDDPIAEPPNDDEKTRYFVAQYQVCPIGHYCDSNGQHECPGGTTTMSTGTSSISGCVMRRGVSGTKFCDSTGNCFYIPASLLYNGAIPGR